MNRLSMDLSDLKLDPCSFDEETWLTGPELGKPKKSLGIEEQDVDCGEDEDLNKWLAGAVKKVDFRTRSALGRKLDKKSEFSICLDDFYKFECLEQKHENKERVLSGVDNSLDMIEEVSNESSSDRGKQKRVQQNVGKCKFTVAKIILSCNNTFLWCKFV